MCVSVNYSGRFANNLLQYTAARLFAEANNLELISDFTCNHKLKSTATKPGENYSNSEVVLVTDENIREIFYAPAEKKHYKFHGYFHRGMLYDTVRAKIKKYFELTSVNNRFSDIAIHIRLGDFRAAWDYNRVIDSSWYIDILRKLIFSNLYIITEKEESYLDKFAEFNPIIRVNKPDMEDWNLMRSFNRIILSNSSFAFTAALFGNANIAYSFKRGLSLPNEDFNSAIFTKTIDGKYEGEK